MSTAGSGSPRRTERSSIVAGVARKEESPWSEAKSLEDLGEVTARWLQGEGFEHPLYGGGPDEETAEILADLVLLNRRGLVTTFSQPAEPIDNTGFGQRAAVEGYASEELARRIATVTLHTDLLVFLYRPGWEGGYQVPITLSEHHPYSWCGAVWGDEELIHWMKVCFEEGMLTLCGAWTVVAIDLKWGRKRRLWRELRRVTNPRGRGSAFSISPHPEHGHPKDHIP